MYKQLPEEHTPAFKEPVPAQGPNLFGWSEWILGTDPE